MAVVGQERNEERRKEGRKEGKKRVRGGAEKREAEREARLPHPAAAGGKSDAARYERGRGRQKRESQVELLDSPHPMRDPPCEGGS